MNPHDIKALLGKYGIRQNKLAADLDVSPSLVTGVIYRKVKSRRVAEAICHAVGRPTRDLFPELAPIRQSISAADVAIQCAHGALEHIPEELMRMKPHYVLRDGAWGCTCARPQACTSLIRPDTDGAAAMTRQPETIIKAYRVTGGAIVRVIRNGRTRRYRVNCRRYLALRSLINLSRQPWSGYFGSRELDVTRWAA